MSEETKDQQRASPEIPSHSAAKRRQSRKIKEFPDDFDERSKANAQQVTKIHEFRRENIRELEPPKKDYFDYDPNEQKKYDALKFETLFKFQTTYKAIKWGVAVGTMFAFHRYYRTRDMNAAAHWFTVMSFVSFFNIWISYGLQEFVTEYGSRKSLSLAARNEYHTNAYKAYLDSLQQTVRPLDDKIQPVLHNSHSQALEEFIKNFDHYLKERYGTTDTSREEIIQKLKHFAKEKPDEMTASQLLQVQILQRDQYQRSLSQIVKDADLLQGFADDVLKGIDNIDLESFDFDKDPDMNYKSLL